MASLKFEVTAEQKAKADKWLKDEVYPYIILQQKKWLEENPKLDVGDVYRYSHEAGYPYEGAMAGGLSYQFTLTSVGTITRAQYKTNSETFSLDLTDYDNW